MDFSNKGTFIAFVVMVAIALSLVGFMIYFIVNRTVQANQTSDGQTLVQIKSEYHRAKTNVRIASCKDAAQFALRLRQRDGAGTAAFVALQLEYPASR